MDKNENLQKATDHLPPAAVLPAATCSGVVRAAKSAGIVGLHAENGLTLREAILILDEINRARGFDCQNLLPVGAPYVRMTGVSDSDFYTVAAHPEVVPLYEHFNNLE